MITVIIPFYNSENLVLRSLNSCLNQKYLSKVILINDKSTDKSISQVKDFVHQHPELDIIILENENNRGPGFSRNQGLKIVETKYVNFLDSDDYFLEKRFEEEFRMMEEDSNLDGVYSPLVQYNESSRDDYPDEIFELSLEKGQRIQLEDFLLPNKGSLSHCGILFKTSFLKDNGLKNSLGRSAVEINMLYESILKGNIVYFPIPKSTRNITGKNVVLNHNSATLQAIDKKWFEYSLNNQLSKELNRYFFKKYLGRHPYFYGKKGLLNRILKTLFAVSKFIITPKLWTKLS